MTALGPADGPHFPASAAAAIELIAAIGLEAGDGYPGRHLQPLEDLARARIGAAHVAFVIFPGAVP